MNAVLIELPVPDSMKEIYKNYGLPENYKIPITPLYLISGIALAYSSFFISYYMINFLKISTNDKKTKRLLLFFIFGIMVFTVCTLIMYEIENKYRDIYSSTHDNGSLLSISILLNLFGFLYSMFMPFISIFITITIVFYVITNYDSFICKYYTPFKEKLHSLIVVEHDPTKPNLKKDFLYFIIASIMIAFLAEVILFVISSNKLIDYVPWLHDFVGSIKTISDVKVGDITNFQFTPGPPIGVLVVFILRQLDSRERKKPQKNDEDDNDGKDDVKYPGMRILIIFIIIVSLILLIDTVDILKNPNSLNSEESRGTHIIPHLFDTFLFFTLLDPTFYVAIAITCYIDFYIFSKNNMKTRHDGTQK
jgi:hypothetical protein